jgi:poly-beta-1,6-N-acetyl-D-glucosamine synthase
MADISFIDGIFFFYMFVGMYMICLFIFIFLQNTGKMFHYPNSKPEPVSVIVPCFNASKTIGNTIESIKKLDYPKELIEIIVVDDKSSDNSVEVIKRFVKKYDNVSLIVNKRNSGGAAEPTNLGIKSAKYEYVAITDDDSEPRPDALRKMLGFLQEDEKNAAVTCAVLVRKQEKFIQRLQAIEYLVIAFGRKILDLVDSVYVTPGPFALYKKKKLFEVGLFDPKNLTQDIEIVWRLIAHGYKAKMSLSAKVYSDAPKKFKVWFRQRIRWNIGGTQSLIKHRKYLFKKGMLGAFIIPYFSFSLFLGIFGLAIFTYLLIKRAFFYFLSTSQSIYAQSTILSLQDLTFAPSILNFLGAALFLLGGAFTIAVISIMNEPEVKNRNLFSILFYLIIYLSIYPFIMITALYKLARGKYSW